MPMRTCGTCGGTGRDLRSPAEECVACDGTGRTEVELEGYNY